MSRELTQRVEDLKLLGWSEEGAKLYDDLLDKNYPFDFDNYNGTEDSHTQNSYPDTEDNNRDTSLDNINSYFSYKIDFFAPFFQKPCELCKYHKKSGSFCF